MHFKSRLAVFISSLLIFGNMISYRVIAKTGEDTTSPLLKSIQIDRKKVRAGEDVVVSIDASDDVSGIDGASIYYISPSGKNSKAYSLLPDENGKLKCDIPINKNDEKGTWKLDSISLRDKAGNTEYVNNYGITNSTTVKDLTVGNFEVTASLLDTTPPVLNSISVDTTKMDDEYYRSVQAIVDASDDLSGIYTISIHYISPSCKNSKYFIMWPDNDGKFKCNISIDPQDEEGLWKVDSVLLIDRVGNTILLNNSEVKNYGVLRNLSNGDFQVNKVQASKNFDVNDDEDIDIKDLAAVAKDFNTKRNDRMWNSQYDYNNDGIIDIYDITELFKNVQ